MTIRGEHLGIGEQDLAGVFINGADCLLISEWKTDRKILALAPAKEGKGDIIIATKSGGIGSCEVRFYSQLKLRYLTWPLQVQFRVFKETVGPLKESAVWVQEKYHPRRFPFILVYCTQTQMKTFHNFINQCTMWLSIGTRYFLVLTSNGSILI